MRAVMGLSCLLVLALIPAMPASAAQPEAVTIATVRERGLPGTFLASGVISDSGTFTSLKVATSAAGAPTFLIVHATYEFVGSLGTFTLENQIKETVTADPNVFLGAGTWVILSGTGASDLFIRTYTGTAHLE